MPTLFLSPSTQEFNPYVGGGNEEYYMNVIADEMIPYLRSSGIQYTRNDPEGNVTQSINQSNAGNYDLHLALHSNAAPESLSGLLRGTDVYYYPGSENSMRAAEIIAANFKKIYPNPDDVKAVPTTDLSELSRTRAPALLIEIAYHDNPEDADWIRNNTEEIARNLVQSLTEYFGIPFISPQPEQQGIVDIQSGSVNIRSKPSRTASIVSTAPKGAQLTVLGKWQDWYVVNYNGNVGYVLSNFITIQ